MAALGKLLFGELVEEFGKAAAPTIRKVLRYLGADASPQAARAAVQKQLPNQNATTSVPRQAATPPKPKKKTPAAKTEKTLAARPAAQPNPLRVIMDEYGVGIADRMSGMFDADTPLSEWRAVADRLSTTDANRASPYFRRPGDEPIVTQAGRMGLPVVGRELAEAQHPSKFGIFSKYKTAKPVSETEVEVSPFAVLPRDRRFDMGRLENAKIVSLFGDRLRAGDTILGVDGLPVNVRTHGGPLFGALQEALGGKGAWASEYGQLAGLRREILAGLEAGVPVFGAYTPMGPGALNQTLEMTDLLHQMAQNSPILKRDLAVFNRKASDLLPGYAGLLHEEAPMQMRDLTQGQRKAFVAQLDKSEMLKQGFPSVPSARYALTEEDLIDAPAGASGYSFVEFGPESLKSMEGGIDHPTYPDRMEGTFEGRGAFVPFDMMFPDFVRSRRAGGDPAGSDLRAFELKKPSQVMNSEDFDRLMQYLRLVGE